MERERIAEADLRVKLNPENHCQIKKMIDYGFSLGSPSSKPISSLAVAVAVAVLPSLYY